MRTVFFRRSASSGEGFTLCGAWLAVWIILIGMCRLLGYLGAPITLDTLVLAPPHSLAKQSWMPLELRSATVNADGWGAGFFMEGDDAPCLYVNTLPIWADANAPHMGRAIRSGCLVAAVRSATEPSSIAQANTQPFASGRLAFVHNGAVVDFRRKVQRRLCDELSDARYTQIAGTSDSEHLLALITHFRDGLEAQDQPESLLRATVLAVKFLSGLAVEAATRADYSIVIADGGSLIALRSSTHGEPPTLYVSEPSSALAPGLIVASEPLDGSGGWRPLPPEHALVAKMGSAPQVLPLW